MSLISIFSAVPDAQTVDISYLAFSYTTGSARYSSVSYVLKKADGKYCAEICPDGVSEEESFRCEADESFARRLGSILRKYHVGRWNGFKKAHKRILDGNSFDMAVRFESGRALHAQGYMRWPVNYRSVRAELDAAFMELYTSAERSDIEDKQHSAREEQDI